MLIDVVIDANVLMHVDNDIEERRDSCIEFVEKMRSSETKLCVDFGYSTEVARNRSRIFHEYFTHLVPGNLGFQIIAYLAGRQRIVEVHRNVDTGVRRYIDRMVRDKTDKVYVQVSFNTDESVLVSHDFVAFTVSMRKDIDRKHGLQIVSAAEAADMFTPIDEEE